MRYCRKYCHDQFNPNRDPRSILQSFCSCSLFPDLKCPTNPHICTIKTQHWNKDGTLFAMLWSIRVFYSTWLFWLIVNNLLNRRSCLVGTITGLFTGRWGHVKFENRSKKMANTAINFFFLAAVGSVRDSAAYRLHLWRHISSFVWYEPPIPTLIHVHKALRGLGADRLISCLTSFFSFSFF